jgi:plasmid stability protein
LVSWKDAAMGVTITLKNIPEEIYLGLKSAAKVHRRSLNSEVIACLERVLTPARIDNDAHLAAAQQIRDEIKGKTFKVADIEKAIDQGRL